MNYILKKFDYFVQALENPKISIVNYFLSFLFIIMLRNFAEVFSDDTEIFNIRFGHYSFAYIFFIMYLVPFFHIFTKESAEKIFKVILPCFTILLLVPFIDMLLTKGKGMDIAYMLPETHDHIFMRYLTYFGSFPGLGITPGIKIEVGIVVLASFFYILLKSKSYLKSILGALALYSSFFWLGASPFLLKWSLEFFGIKYEYSDNLLYNYYILLFFIFGMITFYIYDKKLFKAIMKDARYLRFLHFFLMFVLGVVVGSKYGNFSYDNISIFYYLYVPICIFFAGLYSIVINNIEDLDIDKISNPERPLVARSIDLVVYKRLGWLFLFVSLFYAASIGFQVFFFIFLCIGNYYLYSAKPYRLKRIPLFSKFMIAFTSLLFMMLGFIMVCYNLRFFPVEFIYFILLGLSLAINFIDLKDYEGDLANNIKTIPTMLGLQKAKYLISFFVFGGYASVYFLLNRFVNLPWDIFLPFLLFPILITWFIFRKPYKEKYVFSLYLISIIGFIAFIHYFFPTAGYEFLP